MACALDYDAEKTAEFTPSLQKLINAIRQHLSANGLISCVPVESLDVVSAHNRDTNHHSNTRPG